MLHISCAETNTTWLLEGIRFSKNYLSYFNEICDNRVFGDFLEEQKHVFMHDFMQQSLRPIGGN